MNNISQDMKYRQSLVSFALKHGVSRASRKYNKTRSYIYFWLSRYNGTIESLACRSRKPHSHSNQHTEEELDLLRRMRRRNPDLGLCEFWCRMRERGYSRSIVSLYRLMRRIGLQPMPTPKPKYVPKPYEKMQYPGQRVQIDVKFVPLSCLVGDAKGHRFYQYTAIDEFSRLRYMEAFEEHNTYSSAIFLEHLIKYFKFPIECVQTDNGFEFTNRFANTCQHCLKPLPKSLASAINALDLILQDTMERSNAAIVKIRSVSTQRSNSIPLPTSSTSLKSINTAQTGSQCARSVGYRQPNILLHTLSNMFDKPTCV